MTGISRFKRFVMLAVFAFYASLLAAGVSRHEPWFDEAQAWLLARDSSLMDMVNIHLRYEGSPGLWHFVLSPVAKAGFPYASLNILAALFALIGVAIFLAYAPFPLFIKILFPFSYFVLYQYAIVARSYVLLPGVLFLTAVLYPKRQQRPLSYALMLALLANISLHGLIMALCFAAIDFFALLYHRKTFSARAIKRYTAAFGLLFLAGLFAAWQLRFPPDHAAVHPRQEYSLAFALAFTARFLSNALTESPILSFCVIALSLWHFWRTRVLSLFLAPVLLMGHLFAFVYSSPWHEGILFLLWMFCLWISLAKTEHDSREQNWNRPLVLAGLSLVLGIHLAWAYTAYTKDTRQTYSAARQVAEHLKSQTLLSPIYATGFHSIAILPYFDRNIFANYQPRHAGAFWDWSRQNMLQQDPELMVLDGPHTIVHGIKTRFNTTVPVLPGYTARKFHGSIFWKDRVFEEDSYIVYEKIEILRPHQGGGFPSVRVWPYRTHE
jgi:hypothetical protein